MIEKEYVEGVITPLLSKPKSLKVEKTIDEMGVLLTVGAAKEDLGILIGKGGVTAKALRQIVNIYGKNHGVNVSVKIDGGQKDGKEK